MTIPLVRVDIPFPSSAMSLYGTVRGTKRPLLDPVSSPTALGRVGSVSLDFQHLRRRTISTPVGLGRCGLGPRVVYVHHNLSVPLSWSVMDKEFVNTSKLVEIISKRPTLRSDGEGPQGPKPHPLSVLQRCP